MKAKFGEARNVAEEVKLLQSENASRFKLLAFNPLLLGGSKSEHIFLNCAVYSGKDTKKSKSRGKK